MRDDDSSTRAGEPMKHISAAIGETFPGEITTEKAKELGISGWRLSDAAIAKIQDIESNIRLAESQSGMILVS
jgi:hypothetical protein